MADKAEKTKTSTTLKVHHLRPAPGAKTAKTRVGRGEGSKGKTAGRGTKGTKARYQVPERFEGGQMPLHMRLPKLRGFKNPFRVEYQVVNLDRLAALFPDGGDVTVDDLVAKGAVRDGQPGQGARHRRDRRQGQRDGPQVLRLRQGEDRGGRRLGHDASDRSLTDHLAGMRTAGTPAWGPAARIPGFSRRVFSAGWAAG